MFEECCIDTGGRRIVNHSGRVTCCTRLYNDGFDEQSVNLLAAVAIEVTRCRFINAHVWNRKKR